MGKGRKELIDVAGETTPSKSATPRVPQTPQVDYAAAKAQNKKILQQVDKQSSVLLTSVPTDFLFGEYLDLHRWTLILTDDNLKLLSEQSREDKFMILESSKPDIPGIFSRFWETGVCQQGILGLNISNAKDVTNVGLIRVARRNSNLRDLNISGCHSLSDASIREVGMNCRQLASLNLSSCHSIDGAGFVAIAECCKLLRKLDISKCRNIQKWGLAKIFYECKKLEEVDVSYLKEVGDEELRILAQNCPNLVKLSAKETPYVSDQGVLPLCQYCPELDYLDVSRSQMAFRITDVCLLTLGQKSHSLRVLLLGGCEHITDVGLAWLAEGCAVIEELDLSGCNRLTDAGMRSIGGACHALLKLNLTQAKLVSDIGIASLSAGCPRLIRLVCSGIFLLSDPRLTVPRKGEKPASWQNAIGIASIAKHCTDLTHLELANCFRIDVSVNRYVSLFTKLTSLSLAGCLEVSSESLVAMAEGCVLLEELNLSDCSKAVTAASMRAVGGKCKEMKTLILGRCEDVKGGAIAGVVLCKKLEKLDLSGCRSLTDDMLMPLSDPSSVPKLKHLSIVGVVTVTDRTLSWMASKVHAIQYFALKGTSVRRFAFSSVRDSFPNSDLVLNENFSGFWPKSRIEDRRLISQYGGMITGFISLQARLRGCRGRNAVTERRRLMRVRASRIVLQMSVRCYLARVRVTRLRVKRNHRMRAATAVQGFFLIVRAKHRVAQRKADLYRQFLHRMATRIENIFRRYCAKCNLAARQEHLRLLRKKRVAAALKIQSFARKIFAKSKVAHIKQLKRARGELEQRKTLMIQRVYRGSLGRMRVAEIRKLKRDWLELCVRSAKMIQYAVRRMWIVRVLNERIEKKQFVQRSAVMIQSLVRGFLARLMVMEMQKGMEAVNMDVAATKLQYAWLRKKARLELKRRRAEREVLIANHHKSATFIQAQVRGYWARITLFALREEAKDFLRAQAELEIWAAIKIQACWRGLKGRMHFDDVVRERKGLWKELFDEEKRKRFFYNKLTGEIRWTIPQDLLDLLPRPKCDNCTFYEAAVECAVCNEFFCSQCWDQVHYGGRRKDHEFRALYDYYGKRLDYGDDTGEPSTDDWPSKWPSDIVTDEVHGWMLRVAPVRAPLSVTGTWEEYAADVPEPVGNVGLSGRSFYFNRATFEATYDKPPDLMPPQAPSQGQYHDPSGAPYGSTQYGAFVDTHQAHGAAQGTSSARGQRSLQLQQGAASHQPGFTVARTYTEYLLPNATGTSGNTAPLNRGYNSAYSDMTAMDQQQWSDEQQQQQAQGYYDAEGNWIDDEFSYMYQSKGGGVMSFKR